MPKYYEYKIAGYYLYFTSHCTIEAMHVHASDRHLTESGSAKFFVKGNGDTVVQNRGILTDREISKIQAFIRMNYQECTSLGQHTAITVSIAANRPRKNITNTIPFGFPAKPFFLRAHGLKNAIRARFLLSGRRKCSRSAEIVQVLRNPLSTRSYFCPDCTLHSQLVGV